MLPCKLRIMIAGYQAMRQQLSEDTVMGSELRRCFTYIAKNIIRGAAKLIDSETDCGILISAQQALEAQATAQDLLQRIKDHDDRIISDRSHLVTSCDLSSIQFKDQLERKSTKYTVVVPRTQEVNIGNLSLPESGSIILEADTVVWELKKTLKICREMNLVSIHSRESLCLQIHHLVDQLPIPDDSEKSIFIWKELSIDRQNESLNILEDILTIYSIHAERDSQTRSYTTLLTLQANIHCLATLINNRMVDEKYPQARLQYYKVPSFGELANKFRGLIYYDRNEFERTQKVIAYFNKVNEKGVGEKLFDKEGTSTVQKNEVLASRGNSVFWNALIESNDLLKEKVDKEGEVRWPTIPEEQLQAEFDELFSFYQTHLAAWELLKGDKGVRPQMPSKRVNLPMETRNLLILESSVRKENTILSHCGCNYVNVLDVPISS